VLQRSRAKRQKSKVGATSRGGAAGEALSIDDASKINYTILHKNYRRSACVYNAQTENIRETPPAKS